MQDYVFNEETDRLERVKPEQPKPPKAYFDKYDIMARYDVGEAVADRIIRQIKSVNGGQGRLCKGKVLPAELERWENLAV